MIRLTNCVGRPVVGSDGRRLGRLRDLVAVIEGPYPPVTALLVGSRREQMRHDWAAVESFGDELRLGRSLPSPPQLHEHELRVVRDVLDVQIVDVSGRRIVRVADVELGESESGLAIAGLDVGAGAILRRLGLDALLGGQPRQVVDWSDMHIVSMRGHQTQLRADRGLLRRTPEQLAAMVAHMPPLRAAEVLTSLGPQRAGDALGTLAAPVAATAAGHMSDEDREAMFATLTAERADELRELGAQRAPARRRRGSRFGKVLSIRRHAPS